jgi:hypothetical protein
LLTVWEIWKERNARVFWNKLSPSFVILEGIKCEARLWVLAGAKRLGELMPGELALAFVTFLFFPLVNSSLI